MRHRTQSIPKMKVKITRAETMIEDKIPIAMRSRFTYENSSGVMMPDGFRCGRSTPGEGTLGRTNSTRCCVFCLLRRVPVFPTRVFLVIVTFSVLNCYLNLISPLMNTFGSLLIFSGSPELFSVCGMQFKNVCVA